MASNLFLPAQPNSDALVNSQLIASIYTPDNGLSLVGNMAAAKSVNNAAVTICNLQALVSGKLLSVQNGPLSNIGAVPGAVNEVFAVTTAGVQMTGGSLALHIDSANVVHSASPYAALTTDTIIPVDPTAGTVTVNLPATAAPAGTIFIVKDITGEAATHNITVSAGGTTTIDAGTTVTISSNYGVSRIFSNGTAYFTW